MNATISTIDEAIAEYVSKLTRAAVDHYRTNSPKMFEIIEPFYETSPGKVYTRIVFGERNRTTGEVTHQSAHAFLKRDDGSIWKPSGWKGPAKNFSRGNVYQLNDELPFTHGL